MPNQRQIPPFPELVPAEHRLDILIAGEWVNNGTTYRWSARRLSTGDGLVGTITEGLLRDRPEAFRRCVEEAIGRFCFGNPLYMEVLRLIPAPPGPEPFMLQEPTILKLESTP